MSKSFDYISLTENMVLYSKYQNNIDVAYEDYENINSNVILQITIPKGNKVFKTKTKVYLENKDNYIFTGLFYKYEGDINYKKFICITLL